MKHTPSPTRAKISWEGDSREVLRAWPKQIREDFGNSLREMQEGRSAFLRVRPMQSIGPGVFELKDGDEGTWYRLIYLARIADTIYVLHCFEKKSAKTDRRDINAARQRLKLVMKDLL